MQSPGWLPLNDYAAKYKISLSTLRRRIHSDEADFRFEGGKYWLADRPISKHGRFGSSFAGATANPNPMAHTTSINSGATHSPSTTTEAGLPDISQAEGVLASANKILQELKQAYISVLQEKESQIMQLKEEVVDLKTLVKILEAENERLRS